MCVPFRPGMALIEAATLWEDLTGEEALGVPVPVFTT